MGGQRSVRYLPYTDICGALCARDYKGIGNQYIEEKKAIVERNDGMETAVRRLLPIECERLQGFPDDWTLIGEPKEVEVKDYNNTYDEDGNIITKEYVGTHTEIEYYYTDENGKPKKVTDSARYKALGNTICLPFWEWMARRIASQYERQCTMGSLFSGIGGFELAFAKTGAFPVWSSEIEEFPIMVAKQHFGDDGKGEIGDYWQYLMNPPE